jgi:hypothetical protein
MAGKHRKSNRDKSDQVSPDEEYTQIREESAPTKPKVEPKHQDAGDGYPRISGKLDQ